MVGGVDIELRDYIRIMSARRWLIASAVAIVTVTAIVASVLQTPVYEAQSVMLVRERNAYSVMNEMLPGISTQPERSIQTHVRLAQMPAVIDAALRQLRGDDPLQAVGQSSGGTAMQSMPGGVSTGQAPEAGYEGLSAEDIRSALTVDADPQTNLLYMAVEDTDPKRAAMIANAMAAQYARVNRSINAAEIQNAGRELSYRLRDTQEDILALQGLLDRKSPKLSTATRRNAKARLKLALGVYQMLANKQEQLKISESIEPGEATIVQPARTPDTPVRPRPLRNALLGLLLGMSLGAAMAFTGEYLDNTLKTPDDCERAFGLSVLGEVPRQERDGANGQSADPTPRLAVTPAARTPVAEAYRALRTSLSYLNHDGQVRTILVTSANPGEGKSSVTANLSAALANAGYSVMAIDADLRNPRLHGVFGVKDSQGLTDVLVGRAEPEEVIRESGDDGLKVITCGPMPPNPSELLNSARMQDLIERVRQSADFVVIDSAPVLAVTDCAVLAPKVDGVLVVAEAGVTTREDAKRMVETLANDRVRLLGVVLNKTRPGSSYGYYSYGAHEPARAAEAVVRADGAGANHAA